MNKAKLKHIWIKWTTWEYWPMWLSNLPVMFFYLWFAARARHLFFFSAANPAIPLGGAMGESKYDILRRIPADVLPKMIFAPANTPFEQVMSEIQAAGITFPLVAKPDIGERGFLVKKIYSPEELRQHLARNPVDFIIQEFVNLPFEASVLYHLFPGKEGRFNITSVCIKEFLHIIGDGKNSIQTLILNNPRAVFQLERLQREYSEKLKRIPEKEEVVALGAIGNHCLGTKFLNGNYIIDEQLIAAFAPICRRIKGVHYGRFDLKSESLESLKNGHFQVMELNGVLGEPAHVYDPTVGAGRAYRDFFRHWRIIFEVSQSNRRVGIRPTTLREAWKIVQEYFAYKRRLS